MQNEHSLKVHTEHTDWLNRQEAGLAQDSCFTSGLTLDDPADTVRYHHRQCPVCSVLKCDLTSESLWCSTPV